MLIVSVLAIFAAGSGSGPFDGHDLFAQMFTLQALNGSAALTALVLAAMVTERNETRERIEAVCVQLAEVVVASRPGSRAGPGGVGARARTGNGRRGRTERGPGAARPVGDRAAPGGRQRAQPSMPGGQP